MIATDVGVFMARRSASERKVENSVIGKRMDGVEGSG